MVAAAAPDRGKVSVGQRVVADQLTLRRRRLEQLRDLGFAQSLPSRHSCLLTSLRPADQPMRASESISVLRRMPKVRQTAALVAPPSSAAITAPSFSASIDDGTAATTTATARGRKPRLYTLLDQRPLELRQRPEDVEQQFALRRGGIDLLGERAERNAALLEARHRGQQMRQRSAEPIQLPDHQAIARRG